MSNINNKFSLPLNVKKAFGLNNRNHISSGSFGSIYNTSNGVVKITKSKKVERLIAEYEFSILAGEHKIAPKIDKVKSGIQEYKSEYYLVLVMQKMDQTLRDYLKNDVNVDGEAIHKELKHKIMSLHDLGICHNDLHEDNIMIKNKTWYIIDYGKASPNTNKCADDISKLGALIHKLNKIKRNKVSVQPRRLFD